MRSLIASMSERTGATVMISSHLLGEIEQMVTQIGILNHHGKMLFEGSLKELQKHSRGGILLRVLDVQRSITILQKQESRQLQQSTSQTFYNCHLFLTRFWQPLSAFWRKVARELWE